MPADDVNKRRAIINIFVHSIYLYDDYFTLIINASKKPLSVDNNPLDDIEETFSGDTYTSAECSSMKPSVSTTRLSLDAIRVPGSVFYFTPSPAALILSLITKRIYRDSCPYSGVELRHH